MPGTGGLFLGLSYGPKNTVEISIFIEKFVREGGGDDSGTRDGI